MTTPTPPGTGGSMMDKKVAGIPLPIILVGGVAILAYFLFFRNSSSGAGTSSSGNTSTTDLSGATVTQPGPGPVTVNVTGGSNNGGGKNPQPKPPVKKKTTRLTRTWTSTGGSTLAAVVKRLTGNSNVNVLTPKNAAAKNWINNVYKKNHNAKMPKGLTFSYQEGTVKT